MKKKDLIVLALVVVVIVEAFSVVLKTVVKSVAHAVNAAFKITSDRTIETDTINLDEFNELSLDVGSVNTYIKAGDDYKLEYHVYSDKKAYYRRVQKR